jgi:hypothetical protein
VIRPPHSEGVAAAAEIVLPDGTSWHRADAAYLDRYQAVAELEAGAAWVVRWSSDEEPLWAGPRSGTRPPEGALEEIPSRATLRRLDRDPGLARTSTFVFVSRWTNARGDHLLLLDEA